MNKKLLSCSAVLIMIVNYTNVSVASDSGSNGSFENGEFSTSPGNKSNTLHNVKNIKDSNIESKILDDCKKMSDNNSDNNNVVDYDEDTMWFDYQALFNKTKNVVLGIDSERNSRIDVKHTDFEKNDFAKTAVFGTNMYDGCDDYYKDSLYEIKSGDVYAQSDAMYNMLDYCKNNEFIRKDSLDYVNYKYMLGIVSSFLSSDPDIKYLLHQESSRFPDSYVDYDNIKNINYEKVISYLLPE